VLLESKLTFNIFEIVMNKHKNYVDSKTWNWIIYLINLTLLITHEIDSAFWKEWELFGMPGDIQGFLIANILIILGGLIGFRYLILGHKSGYYFALACAASGIFAFCIHMYFIMTGHQEFKLFVSIAILIAALIVSLIQGSLALSVLRGQK
jgi:hypothetical protein